MKPRPVMDEIIPAPTMTRQLPPYVSRTFRT